MALGLTQDNRLLSLETPLGEDMLLIRSFTVTEQISGLFDMDLEMMAEVVNASKISAEKLIGQKVSIRVALSDDYSTSSHRYFHGIVSRFSQGGRDEHFVYYQAEVVPWLWLLTLTSDCRIFQDLTVPEIVTQIFDELKGSYPGLVEYRDATTAGKYTKLDYCVQYRETDFNFISRLLEQEGICYFFEHEEDKHTLVLADAPSTHQLCPNQSQARYQPEGGTGEWESTITSWEVKQELRSGKYSLRDFHFQMPTKTLEVAEPTTINVGGNGKLELYDYPGEYA
ncbi:MAG: type VI secretion system tip protein VgrG, partial [Nitrospinota bacterium]